MKKGLERYLRADALNSILVLEKIFLKSTVRDIVAPIHFSSGTLLMTVKDCKGDSFLSKGESKVRLHSPGRLESSFSRGRGRRSCSEELNILGGI